MFRSWLREKLLEMVKYKPDAKSFYLDARGIEEKNEYASI